MRTTFTYTTLAIPHTYSARVDRTLRQGYLDRMALVGLVRVATVARALGTDRTTCRRWLSRIGYEPIQAPVAARFSGGSSPLYVTLEAANALVELMLGRQTDRRARRRARDLLREHARRLEDSTRRIEHVPVGGTGSDTPWLKPAL